MAVVCGALQIRNYTDKDGNKRRNAEVIASSIYFADSKPNTEQAQSFGTAPVSDFAEIETDDSKLPF